VAFGAQQLPVQVGETRKVIKPSQGVMRPLGTVLGERRFPYSAEDRLMKSEDIFAEQAWRFAFDAGCERVAAWQRNNSGELVNVTLYLRDEGGRALSDWPLIPGGSFGRKRDDLYAGDWLELQLVVGDGEPLERRYICRRTSTLPALVDSRVPVLASRWR
jgi:hypothetical protein